MSTLKVENRIKEELKGGLTLEKIANAARCLAIDPLIKDNPAFSRAVQQVLCSCGLEERGDSVILFDDQTFVIRKEGPADTYTELTHVELIVGEEQSFKITFETAGVTGSDRPSGLVTSIKTHGEAEFMTSVHDDGFRLTIKEGYVVDSDCRDHRGVLSHEKQYCRGNIYVCDYCSDGRMLSREDFYTNESYSGLTSLRLHRERRDRFKRMPPDKIQLPSSMSLTKYPKSVSRIMERDLESSSQIKIFTRDGDAWRCYYIEDKSDQNILDLFFSSIDLQSLSQE